MPVPLGELWTSDPELREPVIDGLLRRGQVGNLISTSKSYKTYLILNLAITMALARLWLERFPTVGGRVLLIDMELQRPDITGRTRDIAGAMHAPPAEVAAALDVLSLRGRNATIDQIERLLLRYAPREYALVIIDPLYKTYPAGFDENSNPQMTDLYRRFERLAEHLDAAVVVVHHASKGGQADKSVIDVGAGAGAQARSPDAHMVIRPHEADDAVVFEARVRSFRPPEAIVLTWRYPLWRRDFGLDPTKLKTGKKGGNADKPQPQPKAPKPAWTPEAFAKQFATDAPQSKDVILSKASRAEGLSALKARGLLAEAESARLIHRHTFPSDNRAYYATRAQTVFDTSVCVSSVPPIPPVCAESTTGAGSGATNTPPNHTEDKPPRRRCGRKEKGGGGRG